MYKVKDRIVQIFLSFQRVLFFLYLTWKLLYSLLTFCSETVSCTYNNKTRDSFANCRSYIIFLTSSSSKYFLPFNTSIVIVRFNVKTILVWTLWCGSRVCHHGCCIRVASKGRSCWFSPSHTRRSNEGFWSSCLHAAPPPSWSPSWFWKLFGQREQTRSLAKELEHDLWTGFKRLLYRSVLSPPVPPGPHHIWPAPSHSHSRNSWGKRKARENPSLWAALARSPSS